jgi:hypothetical protein
VRSGGFEEAVPEAALRRCIVMENSCDAIAMRSSTGADTVSAHLSGSPALRFGTFRGATHWAIKIAISSVWNPKMSFPNPLHDPVEPPARDPPYKPLRDPPGDPTYEPSQPMTEPTPNPAGDPSPSPGPRAL